MKVSEKLAIKVAEHSIGSGATFDPTLILIIAEIILTLVQIFKMIWPNKPTCFSHFSHMGPLKIVFVRAIVVEHLAKAGAMYLKKSEEVTDEIVDQAHDISEEDFNMLYQEV